MLLILNTCGEDIVSRRATAIHLPLIEAIREAFVGLGKEGVDQAGLVNGVRKAFLDFGMSTGLSRLLRTRSYVLVCWHHDSAESSHPGVARLLISVHFYTVLLHPSFGEFPGN